MTAPLARVVRTCIACPSQWDAWTMDGQYLYMRYRSGLGTVQAEDSPDSDMTTEPIIDFGEPSHDGEMSLAEFLAATGLTLAPDAVVIGEA